MKTFKFKLYPAHRNKNLYRKIEIAGKIYNHIIATHKVYYRLFKKYPSRFTMMNHLAKLKNLPEFSYWKELNSQTIQDIAERIDRGYQLFFKTVNKRPPRFRKSHKFKSFLFKQTGYKFSTDNKVAIQRKIYKYFKSREIEGNIKTVVVKRDNVGDLFLFVKTDAEATPERYSTTCKKAGFDFGLKTFLTGSDGSEIQSPLFYNQALAKKRELDRVLSGTTKRSNNWKRAKLRISRQSRTTVHKRRDWMFKLARKMCYTYSVISLETLSLISMAKRWGRKVLDLAWDEFTQILKYVAKKFNTRLVFIDKWFPSTKLCSECGSLIDSLKLSDREWTCPSCHTLHHRDKNAAININREGASSLTVGDVRLPSGAALFLPVQLQPFGLRVCQTVSSYSEFANCELRTLSRVFR